MRINVKPIQANPEKRLPFQFTMDLSDLEFGGRHPICDPVEVEGCVKNTAGVLELSLTARSTLQCVCDRCAKEFRRPQEAGFSCMLAEELQNEENDEIVLLENGEVDADELARTAFVLSMDTKTLCSEDCKGLCPRCGADLNLGPCSCKKEPDPRFAVLARLLENSDHE
jgi:Predicted metal-binding, possibly nucleic acid-binding protein